MLSGRPSPRTQGYDEASVSQVDPNQLNLVAQVSIKEPKVMVAALQPLLESRGVDAAIADFVAQQRRERPPEKMERGAIPQPKV